MCSSDLRTLTLNDVKIAVLDEADEMLDMGFKIGRASCRERV